MASPLDAVEDFMGEERRRNPGGGTPSGTDFLEYLIDHGYDFGEFGEEEWRGMAEDLGMDDAGMSDFLENVASYLE